MSYNDSYPPICLSINIPTGYVPAIKFYSTAFIAVSIVFTRACGRDTSLVALLFLVSLSDCSCRKKRVSRNDKKTVSGQLHAHICMCLNVYITTKSVISLCCERSLRSFHGPVFYVHI